MRLTQKRYRHSTIMSHLNAKRRNIVITAVPDEQVYLEMMVLDSLFILFC